MNTAYRLWFKLIATCDIIPYVRMYGWMHVERGGFFWGDFTMALIDCDGTVMKIEPTTRIACILRQSIRI